MLSGIPCATVLVEALPIAKLFPSRLVFNALWKTLLFGLVTLVFRFIDELIPLIPKHEGLVAAIRALDEEVAWPQFWVFQLWLFSALLCYCLASELVRRVGTSRVREMVFGSKSARL